MRDESRAANRSWGEAFMMRQMLLGGVVAVAVCGVATAESPRSALPEGREVDPVVREFYQGERPTPPASAANPVLEAPLACDARAWPVLTTFVVLRTILSGVELPLGPCVLNGM